jgi:hypothetical protein
MTVDERPTRTAIRNAAVGVFLTLAFCGVAIFYFETGRSWFVPINLVLAAVCSSLIVRNIRVYRILQQRKGTPSGLRCRARSPNRQKGLAK